MTTAESMAELRLEVNRARALVREAEDALHEAKVLVLTHLYREHPGKALGENEAERKNKADVAFLMDDPCVQALERLRAAQTALGVFEATLAGAEDMRREREYELRVRELDAR